MYVIARYFRLIMTRIIISRSFKLQIYLCRSLLGRLFESYATPQDTQSKGEDNDDLYAVGKVQSVGSDMDDHADQTKM